VPGKHDLREYLFTAEGDPATNLPALTVTIADLLPNPHDGWLEESAAPVITDPVCGASSTWPRDPIRLAWRAVDGAASYTIEIDCLNCRNHLDPWVSQSGTPWQIKCGLQSPSDFFDVINTVQRDGGRAMRWRVWALDRIEGEGPKSDWCVTTFSGSGLPTPGARTP
jgi:hypothetical protein